jgi:predicted DNA-binding antitoxin AbrB/MazE fold protein
MTFTVQATYENGILRPDQPLPLREREKVDVVVHTGIEVGTTVPTSEQKEALTRLFSLELPVADWDQMEQEIIRGAVGP